MTGGFCHCCRKWSTLRQQTRCSYCGTLGLRTGQLPQRLTYVFSRNKKRCLETKTTGTINSPTHHGTFHIPNSPNKLIKQTRSLHLLKLLIFLQRPKKKKKGPKRNLPRPAPDRPARRQTSSSSSGTPPNSKTPAFMACRAAEAEKPLAAVFSGGGEKRKRKKTTPSFNYGMSMFF